MTTVDANVTIGCWPGGQAPELTVPDLLAEMDRFGIDRAVVRHSDAVNYDATTGNRALVLALAGAPRLTPAFVVGPLDCGEHGGPEGLLAELELNSVRSVWLYPNRHGWTVDGPESSTLLVALRAAGCSVHVDLDECDWTGVNHLARQLPEQRVVVSNVGYRTLSQAFAVLSEHDKVAIDTSFLASHNGLELITRKFGAERLVFGTGTPLRDAGGAFDRLATSGLTPAEREVVQGPRGVHPNADAPVVFVDAHAHIGKWPSSYTPDHGPDDLIAGMDRTGTAVAIASSLRAIWSGEVRTGNSEMIAAARSHPGRLYVHAVANPHRPDDQPYLAELLELDEVKGLKIHPHTHECSLDDERYDWICEMAAQHQIPILAHTFAGTWHSDPWSLDGLAARHPSVQFVAGHAGASPAGYRTTIAVGRRRSNVHAEICGSAMTGRWLQELVAGLGPHRVIHGSDATLIDARYATGRVRHAELTSSTRRRIAASNACALYRIADPTQ